MRLDDWRTEADEEGWGDVIAAFAVLVLWVIVGFLWLVTFAVAQ